LEDLFSGASFLLRARGFFSVALPPPGLFYRADLLPSPFRDDELTSLSESTPSPPSSGGFVPLLFPPRSTLMKLTGPFTRKRLLGPVSLANLPFFEAFSRLVQTECPETCGDTFFGQFSCERGTPSFVGGS